MDITQQPYIELEYKGSVYSFEILGKHYSFDFILKKDIVPTLNLIVVNNLLLRALREINTLAQNFIKQQIMLDAYELSVI